MATRASSLARWQASWVADQLGGAELVVVSTEGDRRRDLPVGSLGGRVVFVREVQQAVLDGRADLAVHSAKDLPALDADGLVVTAVPFRADPRDALVGVPFDELEPGATVATGSPRRRAQLAWRRPDLTFRELRGNIETRLAKVPPGGAVVVAMAALERLGLGDRATDVLGTEVVLPQGGQGALAIECRSDDTAVRLRVAAVDHEPSRLCVAAERAFLAALGGGCDAPAGALAVRDGKGGMKMEVVLARGDGGVLARRSAETSLERTDPAALQQPFARAQALGRSLAAELLDHCGGEWIMGSLARQSVAAPHP